MGCLLHPFLPLWKWICSISMQNEIIMYLQFWYSLSKMKSESGWYVTVSEDIFSVVEVEVAVELLSAVVWVVWRVIIVSCIIFLFFLIWNCDSYVIEKAFVLGDGATWSWFCDHCAFDVGDLVWFSITLWVLTSTVSADTLVHSACGHGDRDVFSGLLWCVSVLAWQAI